jgi:hypothetical protein
VSVTGDEMSETVTLYSENGLTVWATDADGGLTISGMTYDRPHPAPSTSTPSPSPRLTCLLSSKCSAANRDSKDRCASRHGTVGQANCDRIVRCRTSSSGTTITGAWRDAGLWRSRLSGPAPADLLPWTRGVFGRRRCC